MKSTNSNISTVLRWAAIILGAVTGYLTMNAYLAKFGADNLLDYILAGAIGLASAVIQAICIYFIPRINYKPVKYAMVSTCVLITAFTVYGLDFKATQGIQKTIENSFSFQMKKDLAESYRDAAKTQQRYNKATKSTENLDKAKDLVAELDGERNLGANSANTRADYENMQIFGFDISNVWKKAAGLLVDTMYYLVLWLMFFGVSIAQGKKLKDILPEDIEDEPISGRQYLEKSPIEHSGNGNGHPVKKNDMSEKNKRSRSKAQENRQKKIKKLKHILETHEGRITKTKLAQMVGVSLPTLDSYFSELEQQGFLEKSTAEISKDEYEKTIAKT